MTKMLPPIFTVYGILMIALGVITFVITYKHVIPIGSFFLVMSGVFILIMRRHGGNKKRQVHDTGNQR